MDSDLTDLHGRYCPDYWALRVESELKNYTTFNLCESARIGVLKILEK